MDPFIILIIKFIETLNAINKNRVHICITYTLLSLRNDISLHNHSYTIYQRQHQCLLGCLANILVP